MRTAWMSLSYRALASLCGERGLSIEEAMPLVDKLSADFDILDYQAWADREILSDDSFASMIDISLKKTEDRERETQVTP